MALKFIHARVLWQDRITKVARCRDLKVGLINMTSYFDSVVTSHFDFSSDHSALRTTLLNLMHLPTSYFSTTFFQYDLISAPVVYAVLHIVDGSKVA